MRFLIALLLALHGAASPRAEPLALRADDWCPHTCPPGEGPEAGDGYLVDLVRAALPDHRMNYQLENWARLRQQKSAPPAPVLVVLGVGRSPRNERHYLITRQPLAHSPYCFFARPGLDDWQYRGVASLSGVRLGVSFGYEFDDAAFQAYIERDLPPALLTRVKGAQAVDRHADMLLAGRSDVVLEDREAMRWAFRQRQALEQLREAGCLSDDTGLYIAVPRRDPRAAATMRALEQGLQHLRRNGEMARILARYGIKPH